MSPSSSYRVINTRSGRVQGNTRAFAIPSLKASLVGCIVEGAYRITSKIARGGMSTVFLARHLRTGELVAIKVLRLDMNSTIRVSDRFLIEMRAYQLIDHPCVVKTHAMGKLKDGRLFLVMEFINGPSLRRVFKSKKTLSVSLGFDIIENLARGLRAAHKNGVFHRDLKPANILLPRPIPGREKPSVVAKIVDFGLARIHDTPRITATNQVMGTPHYLSPEQVTGKSFDHRVDIYALGIIMYEMFTGMLPFKADDAVTLLREHIKTSPTPIRKVLKNTPVPKKLDRLVMACLAKKPGNRPQRMDEILAEIQQIRSAMDSE